MTFSSSLKRALAATGVASLIVVAAATAAYAQQFTFPYNNNPQNPCTGDTMIFDGNAHLIFDVTSNPDGSFHVREHLNTQGVTAIGVPSGDEYVVTEVSNDDAEFDVSSSPTTSHTTHHLNILHKANNLPNDDLYQHSNVTTTWVNGVPTSTTHSEQDECK